MTIQSVTCHFKRPEEIPLHTLEQIRCLIEQGKGVGTSWVWGNLRNAFLIAYAEHAGMVVGTSTHKYPREDYRSKIETATGLDLSGYLERGYTAVSLPYRGTGIGGRLIKGLIERTPGKKVYVTIRMDNTPPLRMTYREGMILAGTFINERTGHELGVFANIMPGKKERG